MNYKTRMLDEILELKDKITKLELYLSDKVKDSSKPTLEEKQLIVMNEYFNILKERLQSELKDKWEDNIEIAVYNLGENR